MDLGTVASQADCKHPCRSFPSTPSGQRQLRGQASHDELARREGAPNTAASPHKSVKKASSLLDLKNRIIPSSAGGKSWKLRTGVNSHGSSRDGAVTPSAQAHLPSSSLAPSQASLSGSIAGASISSTTSSAGRNAWSKLTGEAATTQALPLTPTSETASFMSTASVPSPRASMEAIGVSAYLRIKPPPHASSSEAGPSNVKVVSDTEATMVDLSNDPTAPASALPRSSSMTSLSLLSGANGIAAPPTHYRFTEVFPDTIEQRDIYIRTTLPLVANLLGSNSSGRMENALVFAYGVSGSGKTCKEIPAITGWQILNLAPILTPDHLAFPTDTVQGSSTGEPGIIPRALDTILNSIQAKQTRSHLRPCRLTGLEITPKAERTQPGQLSHLTFDASTVRRTMLSGDVSQIMRRDDTGACMRSRLIDQRSVMLTVVFASPTIIGYVRVLRVGELCRSIQRESL